MKHAVKIMSLALCAAVLLSLPALAANTPLISPAPDAAPVEPLAPVRVWGKVTKLESGSLLIANSDKDAANSEVVVHLPEGTPCVDAVSGLPMDMSKVKDGDTLYAWVGPAMTMSLPPQASAVVVVGNIPADYRVPEYYEITEIVPTATIAIYPAPERTEVKLKAAGGQELTVPVAAKISPWLTKNIVTVDDLVPGSQALVWKDKDGKVEKVLLLPYAYRGYLEAEVSGTVRLNGEALKVQGRMLRNEDLERLYLPLRATAEAAGYEVKWVSGKGAVVYENNGTELFSVLPGSDVAKTAEDEHGLLGGCVIDQGVTYLPADDLAYLLNLYFRGV